jgi:Transmembrane protein 43
MYQWKEETNTTTEQSMGGSQTTQTTYSYHRVWSESAIDSGGFHHIPGHVNPVMPMSSVTFDSTAAALGAYHLDPGVLDEISDLEPFEAQNTPPQGYQAQGGGFYRGQDPANPAIGDLRVTFEAVRSQVFSLVDAQVGSTLAPYHAANGYEIALVKPGMLSATALFAEKTQEERLITGVLRAVGFILMVIAFALMAGPVVTLFAVVPFLEGIVEAGTFLVALTFAVPATLVTIAIAWAAHRPLIGGALLAAALLSFILLSRLHKVKTPRPAP